MEEVEERIRVGDVPPSRLVSKLPSDVVRGCLLMLLSGPLLVPLGDSGVPSPVAAARAARVCLGDWGGVSGAKLEDCDNSVP